VSNNDFVSKNVTPLSEHSTNLRDDCKTEENQSEAVLRSN